MRLSFIDYVANFNSFGAILVITFKFNIFLNCISWYEILRVSVEQSNEGDMQI